MQDERKISHLDGVGRSVVGISLLPAFGTLYQRLTLLESMRFKAAHPDSDAAGKMDSTDEIEMSEREQREEDAASVTTGADLRLQDATTTRKSADIRGVNDVLSDSDLEKEGVGKGEMGDEIADPPHLKELLDYVNK
ncbi:hypothetical protein D9619_010166 [Psilocybe cf. subviscida]|uniref:Uncharacterized protein n=1 Tax=Psilocybe cf. subviscida TaxID=2480587 RepID=A0A8H5ERR8_9AGAR|nr:hypothetical protein D9619_010166 [Psilocybe cf. subviscida]